MSKILNMQFLWISTKRLCHPDQKRSKNLNNFRDFRVFEEMARFIVSRNTVQCRSHHQKLE